MLRFTSVAVIFVVGFVWLSTAQSSVVVSTFDTGLDGWTAVNLFHWLPVDEGAAYAHQSAGGNPGGYIEFTEPEGNSWNDWAWFSAPADFLGDKSAHIGDVLSFDLRDSHRDGILYPSVILASGDTYLHYRSAVPGGDWTHFDVTLQPSASSPGVWSKSSLLLEPELDDDLATDSEMTNVLSNLTALYIEADWHTGVDATGLDNVMLGRDSRSVPEASSFAVFTIIGLGLFCVRSCRRRG